MTIESERLAGDVAMVVGAASGIGQATALKLALNRAVVACADIDDQHNQETVRMIEEQGGKAFAVHMDMTKTVEVKKAMADVYERAGKLSILVNVAAILLDVHILESSDEEFERVLLVDVGGYFRTMREVHPYMKASGGGRIVNFTSTVAFSGSIFCGPGYVAAKGGIVSLSKYCATFWARDNIRVNVVCPGRTLTPIITLPDGSVKGGDENARVPLGRIAYPIDQANAVMFLVSHESDYITGTTLHVNGGKYMFGT